MKRFFPFLGLILLILTACLPPLEERHEFIVEVVGNAYLDDVMDWYQPSYGDYLVQEHPVIVLYYPDGSYAYSERAAFYEQNNDFVAAAGEIVDTADLKDDLNQIWSSYYPIYDVDVWWQADQGEWQARVKDLTKDVKITKFFVVTFKKVGNYCEVVDVKDEDESEIYCDDKGVYHLGPLSGVDGFVAFVQEAPSNRTLVPVSNTKILGAEVRWIK
ncbi:hypothetical protein Tpet_0087 [Thermotoga petrophila RKU-1]|jgi:hypothetical protein|uniref:Lipoprotein n=1 Tax=Thermotoga petrophila (strain ATCC BAA-488 / DSM 13995 / JCM 10881 / RKU-1) TaxID=390874 RepID=A5IIU3_THEP1|nr:hypothetical protein [Thermotoga petrophila]ABQ46116.1 hypothetical protein Tpet_0087 [Thermotoga petrophila RKU-1]MDK2898044.1 hypothetical protein [Thermotoga sp.]